MKAKNKPLHFESRIINGFYCGSCHTLLSIQFHKCVRVAQLEVKHAVGRSSLGCAKLKKSLQKAFSPLIAGSFRFRSKHGGPVYPNNIVRTSHIHLCPSHIGQVLRLPGDVNPHVLQEWYVLTIGPPSNLPFLRNPRLFCKTYCCIM